jgi:hypothetical protein
LIPILAALLKSLSLTLGFVAEFGLCMIAQEGQHGLMTVVVLDNSTIHNDTNHETLDHWFIEHR